VSRSADELRSLILWTIVVTIVAGFIAWCAYLVRGALLLIYVSGLLAIGFSPMVRWIEKRPLPGRKRKLSRTVAALIFYVGLLAIVAGILEIILPALIEQVRDLVKHLPEYLANTQNWLVSHHLIRRAFSVQELLEHGPSPNTTVSSVVGVVNHVVGFVITAFTVLLLSFYFLVGGEGLFKEYLRWLPRDQRTVWQTISTDVALKVGAWMTGQFILCALIGTTAGIGFYVIGLPYFYVLAIVCGVGELIPMLGPVFSAVPALAVAATVNVHTVVIVAIFLFVQQQLENNVIVPRIMQKQTGMNPIVVVIAIIIGGSLLGVLGALLAVPTAAVIQILVREYLNYKDAQ
jgi:predicted PurR-regulated permease PerM